MSETAHEQGGPRGGGEESADRLFLHDLGPRIVKISGVVGVVALAAAILLGLLTESGKRQFFPSYLVSFCYFLSLMLGGMFFVLVQHATKAGWSVAVRRLAEGVAHNALLMAVLAIPVLIGLPRLYEWTHAEAVAHDHLLALKAPYLNVPFFIVRMVIYFAVWLWIGRWFFARSRRQDETLDVSLTLDMQRMSGPALILFALTLTFASFDLLMSLSPHWFSTIFGVYYFSGAAVGFFALLPLMALLLQRASRIGEAVNEEHYHDLGKLVLGFVVFWAYIAFSQYMLIWYANIPEETMWYLARQSGPWAGASIALLVGHFFVPFLLIMSRHPKRREGFLAAVAAWVLLMHWLDLYWIVMPGFSPDRFPLHFVDLLCFLGVGGLFFASTFHRLRHAPLIPVGDPRLEESLTFENV